MAFQGSKFKAENTVTRIEAAAYFNILPPVNPTIIRKPALPYSKQLPGIPF
jgi:hypothetical protein